jgi:exonuclease III
MAGAGFHSHASHQQAWDYLESSLDFDIALLQEAITPRGIKNSFADVLFQKRYPESNVAWGNCIVSRRMKLRQVELSIDETWEQLVRCSSQLAECPEAGLYLINVHSNAKNVVSPSHNEFIATGALSCAKSKYWEIEVVSHFLSPILTNQSFVLGGDINSGRLFDSVYRYSNNGTLWENLERQGFIDLRPKHFENEVQTFFRPNAAPYQLDHFFGSDDISKCTSGWSVLTEVAQELKLSDHAPVVVEIDTNWNKEIFYGK